MLTESMDGPTDTQMTLHETLEACGRLIPPALRHSTQLCARIAASLSWMERSEQVLADIEELRDACVKRSRSEGDTMVYLPVIVIHILGLQELYCGAYYERKPDEDSYLTQMGSVIHAWKGLLEAHSKRIEDDSPQAKYAEAKLSAQRSIGQNYLPGLLDDFPELHAFTREQGAQGVKEYLEREVHLRSEDTEYEADLRKVGGFLDAIQMIAGDGKDPAKVANPPARVLHALEGDKTRQDALHKLRWGQTEPRRTADPESGSDIETFSVRIDALSSSQKLDAQHWMHLGDSKMTEAGANIGLDLRRAMSEAELSGDQIRLLEAQLDGLKVQESGAPEILGWTPKKLASVRRSLEPGRPAGKRLREKLATYAPPRYFKLPENKNNSKNLS